MLLLHRALALGAPRRTCASSITSSWYSVARCTSSITAPPTVTCQASGSGPSCAESTVNSGRKRLPPAWNRCCDRLGHQLVGFAQLGGHQVLDAGHSVADVGGESGVAEIHARHHGRWCPHVSNILVGSRGRTGDRGRRADVVVVGAGPAGSAAAAWAARAGRDVLVVDSAQFPRDKACGDGLTPRAVAELELLGLGPWLDSRIRHRGLRMSGFGADVEVEWPGPSFPSTGSAVPRVELDDRIRSVAADDGAKMLLGVKAVDVEHDSSGRVEAVVLDSGASIGCTDLIVADGARSTLGRVLGRQWHQETVYGVAVRGYIATPRSHEPWITSHLELRSPEGKVLPGYGWIFPLGNGEVNIGVGALATSKRPRRRGVAAADVLLHRRCAARSGASTASRGRACRRCCRWAGRCRGSPGRTGC